MITGTEIAMIITASGAFLTSAGGVYVSILNRRVVLANSAKIEEVHKATNSMKDELVALTRKDAHREGVQAGIELASTIQP